MVLLAEPVRIAVAVVPDEGLDNIASIVNAEVQWSPWPRIQFDEVCIFGIDNKLNHYKSLKS